MGGHTAPTLLDSLLSIGRYSRVLAGPVQLCLFRSLLCEQPGHVRGCVYHRLSLRQRHHSRSRNIPEQYSAQHRHRGVQSGFTRAGEVDEISRTSGDALAKASKDDHSTGVDFGDVSVRVSAVGVDGFLASVWLVTAGDDELGRVRSVHQLLRGVLSAFHCAVFVARSWTEAEENVPRALEKTLDRT